MVFFQVFPYVSFLVLESGGINPLQWRIQDFPKEGASTPRGVPTYNFAKFSRKLREIERIWTPGCAGVGGGGGGGASLPPPLLDLPMHYWLGQFSRKLNDFALANVIF